MPYISDYEYEQIKRRKRFSCPNCGNEGRITGYPDYRYGNSAEYTVKCGKCNRSYGVSDDCTG